MFNQLTQRLSDSVNRLIGQGRLTEDNIKETLQEIRITLIEADVALPVVKQFIEDVRSKAVGHEVLRSIKPGQALVKVVHDEIVKLLGEANSELNLQQQPPAVILMAGLQGSGKTTTVGKLAYWLKNEKEKKILLASTDVYRPAAIDQLAVLAKQLDVDFFATDSKDPVTIAKSALQKAKNQFYDLLIIDTAGRLHIDEEMMAEIRALHQTLDPIETLFVVDSMTGQDAANTAKAFHEALPLTGVILTKTDGDARGGAALSVRTITGKPIKFIGIGEKIDALEPFYPDRIASRILGMGDVLSLVEEAQRKIDKKEATKIAKKIKKGQGFDLEDFKNQLQQMRNMGGMSSLLGKIPGMGQLSQASQQGGMDEKMFTRMEAIINSMTPQERRHIAIINGSRKRRIAQGSGTQIQDINRLLKQFLLMQKMMKKLKGGGMMKMMRNMKGMLPPGFPPM